MNGCETPVLSAALQVYNLANQIRKAEEALEDLPELRHPAFSGATSMRTLVSGSGIIVVGFGHHPRAELIEPVGKVVCSFSDGVESLFVEGPDGSIFDLVDIGVMPDGDGNWSESFLSIPDEMWVIDAAIGWLRDLHANAPGTSGGGSNSSLHRGAEKSAKLLEERVREVHGLGKWFD